MLRRVGPVKVRQDSLEFKLKAVKLSQLKGVEVQAVADTLEIHPFMLSRWRKEVRDGVLRGRVSVPPARAGLIFHSDRGSEFLGTPFRQRLALGGVQQSMTRGGAPGENAHMESVFHSLKADVIHGRSFPAGADLRHELRRDVRYDNHQRLHSSLGYQSPVDYEHGAA